MSRCIQPAILYVIVCDFGQSSVMSRTAATSAFEGFESFLWRTVSRRSIAGIARCVSQDSRVWQHGLGQYRASQSTFCHSKGKDSGTNL